ncbi:MAG: hypothetical protein OXC30_05435 [Alphaproteobacteria bacterium]|nr:hypothetical protein [Alphaproteobacteria bacterium]
MQNFFINSDGFTHRCWGVLIMMGRVLSVEISFLRISAVKENFIIQKERLIAQ